MNSINQSLKEDFLSRKAYYFGLCALAVLLTVYACFSILPLFNAFFVDDDFMHMSYAYEIKHDPLSFFVWNYGGWWRPLGYLAPSLILLLAGFNPFPFHLFAFLVYFAAGIAVARFAIRLRGLESGLIAYCFFIIAPSLTALVGFSTQATQDGLATLLYLLALTSAYRAAPDKDIKKPYWGSFIYLLISVLSKDSWVGLIPALIFIDFLNYPRSTFLQRLRRMYLFSFLFIAIPLRVIIIGEMAIRQSTGYLEGFISPNRVTSALSLPFYPYIVSNDPYYFNPSEFLIFAILLTASILLTRERRKVTLMLWTAFCGLSIILIPAGCLPMVNGYYHIIPLLAIAVVLVSFLLLDFVNLFKKIKPLKLLVFIVLANQIYLLYPVRQQVVQLWYDTSLLFKRSFDSFSYLVRNMPKDTHIYSFQLYPSSLVHVLLLRRTNKYTIVSMKGKQFINQEDFISGDERFVMPILKEKSQDPNARFIAEKDFEWRDITDNLKRYLNGQANDDDLKLLHQYIIRLKK